MARTSTTRRRRPPRRRGPANAPAPPVVEPLPGVLALAEGLAEPTALEPAEADPDLPLASPETALAARVPPPQPDRPLPGQRRAIFFDVENSSRAQHLSRVLEHLAIDRSRWRTELIAVGNWRVIGSEAGRLLARHGAQLVHSAPSTGVRDWSDLRIAVTAGVWLAGARPGDTLEIISDDRAFDAVGDVAAALGIDFRRMSYRALAVPGPVPAEVEPEREPEPRRDGHRAGERRGRGRGRGRSRRDRRPVHAVAAARVEPRPDREPAPPPPVPEPHTAPHDEIVSVVQDLMQRGGGRPVLIDTLANALKARGFRRPPGSPRLITRLRRIKELSVSAQGMITLVGAAVPDGGEPAGEAIAPDTMALPPEELEDRGPGEEPELEDEGPSPGNEKVPAGLAPTPGRRRRSRRGGRRRRRRGPSPAATPRA